MKSLFLLVVLGLFLLACDSVSTVDDKVGADSSADKVLKNLDPRDYALIIEFQKKESITMVGKHKTLRSCKEHLEHFILENVEFFEKEENVQICCSQKNENNKSGKKVSFKNNNCLDAKAFIRSKTNKSYKLI